MMTNNSTLYCAAYSSPLGAMEVTVSDNGVTGLFFRDQAIIAADRHPLLREVVAQLAAYFSGKLNSFTVPLDYAGTDFQQRVWKELLMIPYGQVITYRDLGIRVGGPTFTRIAGQANARNPISLIIPCHRVIGMNGALTGYGGGIWRKKWLLEFEQRNLSGFSPLLF